MSAAFAENKLLKENLAVKVTSKAQPRTQAPPLVIAFQFDHSKIVAALINEQGRAVEEREITTPRRTTRAAAVEVAKQIVALAVSQSRAGAPINAIGLDRKSTRLNSSHLGISYAVFCLKKKKQKTTRI